MPKISVVIPVYNGEKTIRETLESVIQQTFSDLEILVINDGSQDDTLKVVQQISDPRIQVISYSNAGLAASRNRGIALATGEYVAFIDADDLWTADKLEAQLKALESNPEAALAYSWTNFIDEAGQFLQTGSHRSESGWVYEKLLTFFFLENGSNFLIRRSVFEQVGTFDESLKASEDWDMCLRIAAHYPFVVVPAPQVLYRQPADSMSTNVVRQEAESLKVLDKAFRQAPASLQSLKAESFGNLYQYLLFKAIAGSPSRSKAWFAAKFLVRILQYSPGFFVQRSRLMSKLLVKILATLVLPAQTVNQVWKKFEQR